MIAVEKRVRQAYLYDFYGELLTEHQRQVYEEVVVNDMSLGEMAEEFGISRQGVHDTVKRCDRILEGYEEKLHLLERFLSMKEKIGEISRLSRIDSGEGKSSGENQKGAFPEGKNIPENGKEKSPEVNRKASSPGGGDLPENGGEISLEEDRKGARPDEEDSSESKKEILSRIHRIAGELLEEL